MDDPRLQQRRLLAAHIHTLPVRIGQKQRLELPRRHHSPHHACEDAPVRVNDSPLTCDEGKDARRVARVSQPQQEGHTLVIAHHKQQKVAQKAGELCVRRLHTLHPLPHRGLHLFLHALTHALAHHTHVLLSLHHHSLRTRLQLAHHTSHGSHHLLVINPRPSLVLHHHSHQRHLHAHRTLHRAARQR